MTPTAEAPAAKRRQDSADSPKDKRRQASEDKEGVGITKAAILLVSVGSEVGSKILRHLSEPEVELVSREVARLGPISVAEAAQVLGEFERGCTAQTYMLQGGVGYAQKMLTEAFGQDTGLSIAGRLEESMGGNAGDLTALQNSDPSQLAQLICTEHPQVIALVLSHLVPSQASAVLIALPPEMRAEAVKRMAQLDQISPETVDRIAGYIGRRMQSLGTFSRESYGGIKAVAELLNRLGTEASDELLAAVGNEDEKLSESIRRLMFVFEDLQKLDKQDMKTLLARIDRKDLTLALKGSNDKTRIHFSQNLSQRSQEMLEEDIRELGPVKIKDVENAQHQIIALVRQLQAEGAIGSQGAGDQYVS